MILNPESNAPVQTLTFERKSCHVGTSGRPLFIKVQFLIHIR